MAFALSTMQLESSAFAAGGAIPTQHTGEGDDISPALSWQGAPEGTKGFAVICHDPDAPLVQNGSYGFVHWVLYNLPASTSALKEGSGEGTAGLNDFGKTGYGGPMPPDGHGVHQYYFWVLALDKATDLPGGLSLPELLKQVEPHLIGMNRLVGTYQRD
ncbi:MULTISPECIES: YbhB/YbcL family Raf kinase inhibitor-like protein [unclassified Halomonas]|uniref:YbhB/YbcL family Raf kinase inhibitor-like protein n=1 Tax=unclassified Halomonas TaxID=2609666 RepID=UPI002468548E|nr:MULTISPECIES: YbhB/YbcL family Raf kinase inhibitor-like protein [unclassified Halomonas]